MGVPEDAHDPTRAGIRIWAYPFPADELSVGTLTGLARKSNGDEVLVTNAHVIGGDVSPTNDQELYQTYYPGVDPHVRAKVGVNIQWRLSASSGIDVAVFDAAPPVTINEGLYSEEEIHRQHSYYIHDSSHGTRLIVEGAQEPVMGQSIKMIGYNTGEMNGHVSEPHSATVINGAVWRDVIETEMDNDCPDGGGYSGSPVLIEERPGFYQILGILFATSLDGEHGYVIPAKRIESAMGITFGAPVPLAHAGDDKDGFVDEEVMLDASGTTNPVRPFAYLWSQIAGPDVILDDYTATYPKFTPETPGTRVFELKATNAHGYTTDTVRIDVKARKPLAMADAAPKHVNAGDTVLLTARGSRIFTLGTPSYTWEQIGGPEVEGFRVVEPTIANFTVPDAPAEDTSGVITFRLTVRDANDTESSAEIAINRKPIANAGPPQNVMIGDLVTLDASASRDPDNEGDLTFYWNAPSGIYVPDTSSDEAQFTAPDRRGGLEFDLTVVDVREGVGDSTVIITVEEPPAENRPPVADAGDSAYVEVDTSAELVGTGTDPDEDDRESLTYLWVAPEDSDATILNADHERTSFLAPSSPGDIVFTFKVTDPHGAFAVATVKKMVRVFMWSEWQDVEPLDTRISIINPDEFEKRQFRTSDYDTIQHRWVAHDPSGLSWGPSGEYRCHEGNREKEFVLSDSGGIISDRRWDIIGPIEWGEWLFDKYIYHEDAPRQRQDIRYTTYPSHNCSETQIVDDPEPPDEDWSSWVSVRPAEYRLGGNDDIEALMMRYDRDNTSNVQVSWRFLRLISEGERWESDGWSATSHFRTVDGQRLRLWQNFSIPNGQPITEWRSYTPPPPPEADAGPDQSVIGNEIVYLDGSGSTGAASYSWERVSGPNINIVDSGMERARFVAPDGNHTITCRLTVTGGGYTVSDTVNIQVENAPPPPCVWGDWAPTGVYKCEGGNRWRQESRHCEGDLAKTDERWVDIGPLVWGEWEDTDVYRGALGNRERKQTRTTTYTSYNCTDERWVPSPGPEVCDENGWNAVVPAVYDGEGSMRRRLWECRTNYGNRRTKWEPDPDVPPPPGCVDWSEWQPTGLYKCESGDRWQRQSRFCEEDRTNSEERWVNQGALSWGDWEFVEYVGSGSGRKRRETRTTTYTSHNCTETRLVPDPEEIWETWRAVTPASIREVDCRANGLRSDSPI